MLNALDAIKGCVFGIDLTRDNDNAFIFMIDICIKNEYLFIL